MLAGERREKIKELIRAKQSMKISELSKSLGVSDMTVHRDIRLLAEEGIIIKTFGGITLARNDIKNEPISTDDCVFCNRKVDDRLSYRLILHSNRVESTCCAHCGLLRHKQLGDQVIQAICHDFFFNTTISVATAWFVTDTTLDIGCCQPQVLTFGKRGHAEGFVKGFGGSILSFSKAMEHVYETMNCCGARGRQPSDQESEASE